MKTTSNDELSVLLGECVQQLTALEAEFIKDCHLSEPRRTLKAFAAKHGLRPPEMAELRVRAMQQLRQELAARKVLGVADIL